MRTEHHEAPLSRAVALFRALAHEPRLRVLLALRQRGPLSVTELLEEVVLEQSALSHQLRILREARLVRARREGKSVVYAIGDEHVVHIVEDALGHVAEEE